MSSVPVSVLHCLPEFAQTHGHWVNAAAAKSLQSCPTLCNPLDGSPPAVLGFSRQEHWRGLPVPSPVHESEKGKLSCSVGLDCQRPHGLQPTRLLCPWDFPGKSTGVGCHWWATISFSKCPLLPKRKSGTEGEGRLLRKVLDPQASALITLCQRLSKKALVLWQTSHPGSCCI